MVLTGSTMAFIGEIGYNPETAHDIEPDTSQFQSMLEQLIELIKTQGNDDGIAHIILHTAFWLPYFIIQLLSTTQMAKCPTWMWKKQVI